MLRWAVGLLASSVVRFAHLVSFVLMQNLSQEEMHVGHVGGSCQLIIDSSISALRHISYHFVLSIILQLTNDNF